LVNGEWRTVPIAPGIVQDSVANVLVLDYGNPESLDLIRRHADELAAVLVEPVQSRRPDLQPREFLHELRAFTAEREIALIFDEVITGFRCHTGGAQAHFGIKADLATYGKVMGGGMPIGAIAGKAEYMDAFDGGAWNYGDASYPTAGVTFFAGTFVRHPLALAAARAVLERLDQAGTALQSDLAERNARMIAAISTTLEGTPFQVPHFSSLFYVRAQDFKFSGLLYALLRHRGIHIWEGRPCFISTAHSDADIGRIIEGFRESVEELRRGDFFSAHSRISVAQPGLTPLTEAQREVWLAAHLGPAATAAFNETCTLELFGALDETALNRAIQIVVQRHDALRATFAADGSGQRFDEIHAAELHVVDATPEEYAAIRANEGARKFDLTSGPLVVIQLVRLAPEYHALLITAHHVACDGWSYDILLQELAILYRGESLPSAMQFAEYVKWEQIQHASAEAEAAERYWLDQFRELPPPLELPMDRSRPLQRSWAGAREELYLPVDLKHAVSQLGARSGATLFATLLAAFQTLLHRLSGSNDLVIGIPAAGQNLVGGHDLIGHCANLLPLRQKVADIPFTELLAQTKSTLLDAFEYQHFTYGRLLQRLNVRRDPGRPPLVSVIFNLDPPLSNLQFGYLKHVLSLNPRRHYQFDLGFNVVDEADGLRVECDYNSDLFDAGTIQRWLRHYATLLRSIAVGGPPQLLTDVEIEQLLIGWNQTGRPYPADEPITAAFERHAEVNRASIAIVDGEERFTYGQLNALANGWARALTQRVNTGDLVGIPAIRSARFVAVALGILKAGAAYVPLSPEDPPERRALLAADCRVVVDLDSEEQSADKSNLSPRIGGGDAAYVLFTSGSTGTPKGVVVPHRAISRLVVNSDYVQFREDDVVAMASNLCFDAATFEIWGALLNGGTLVVTPADALLTPTALSEHLKRHAITTLFLTTSLFHQMAQQAPAMFGALRNLVFGGEAADAHCVRLVIEDGKPQRLVNGYGPTETTTFAVCHVCEKVGSKVPIGVPSRTPLPTFSMNEWNLCRLALQATFTSAALGVALGLPCGTGAYGGTLLREPVRQGVPHGRSGADGCQTVRWIIWDGGINKSSCEGSGWNSAR
jgi:non-ribosomal peptide synthetase component F